MDNLFYALAAVTIVSLVSLIGVFALSLSEKLLDAVLFYLVSFASGAILGAAFFDLILETVELVEVETATTYIILGFIFFYLLERSIYWYHGHGHFHNRNRVEISKTDERAGVKGFTYLNLLGDGAHNLIDGMVIGASFLVSVPVGLAATLAVIFHELPQEIGDFAILVYGGLKRITALALNFLTALAAVLGVAIVYLIFASNEFIGFLLGFAGGGFTYISAAELIPELRVEKGLIKSMVQFLIFLLALLIIWNLTNIFSE